MNKYSSHSGGKKGRRNKTDSRRLLEQAQPVEGKRHKIIVGIDYGTTFSGILSRTLLRVGSLVLTQVPLGVSYVTTDKSDIEDINIITQWPGRPGSSVTSWKTPTRIAYQRENHQLEGDKWGFEVNPKLNSYSWTKLLLDKNATAAQYDDPSIFSNKANPRNPGMMQLPHFRDAPGVCEDYLHKVFEYVSASLRREMTDVTFETTPMECWITLPAIWSDEAKEATLKAAKRAGFGNRPQDEVFTIAEPEAAAFATLKKFTSSRTDVLNPVKVWLRVFNISKLNPRTDDVLAQ
jgi:hypothetical protein